MADVAATAFGIAGGVGVLQSLLQCYKDFLTARNFGDDFAYLQLRTALLECSTSTWAIAVGVVDKSGTELNQFHIQDPSQQRAELAAKTLNFALQRLNVAKDYIDTYTAEEPVSDSSRPGSSSAGLVDGKSSDDKPSKMKKIADKFNRTVHRQHDSRHPGTWKRTEWALIDKVQLEAKLAQVAELVNQLNSTFSPANRNQQLESFCDSIKALNLSPEDIKEIGEAAADKLSQTALKMYEGEVLTGNRFKEVDVADNGIVNVGDYFHQDWKGADTSGQRARNDVFGKVTVRNDALVNIGDTYGGKGAIQLHMERRTEAIQREEAAKKAKEGLDG